MHIDGRVATDTLDVCGLLGERACEGKEHTEQSVEAPSVGAPSVGAPERSCTHWTTQGTVMVMPRLEALATMWLPVLVGATSRRVPALTPDLAAALLPPIPPPRTRMAQLEWNYSLPYSIFYNDAGNYPPSVYDPDNASRYGFITDDVAHHHGTATFSQIEEDSLYPNFVYVSGADNVSYTSDCEKAHGMRRDSPLGALCCAKGGCVPQEADLSAIAAMAARHAEAIVPPDMAGNCVLDHEQWKPIVIPELKFAGYCPSEYMLPKSDGDWRPLPTPKTLVEGETLWWNYSLGLVQQKRPTLSLAEAEAEAAKQFLSAATAVYVTVLQAVKRARPRCHWGYWGANGLCSWHRLCTTQNATSGDPVCGFDNPAYRQLIWNFTQQQLPIVQESDALFPEIYLESPLRDSVRRIAFDVQYVTRTMS